MEGSCGAVEGILVSAGAEEVSAIGALGSLGGVVDIISAAALGVLVDS